MNDLAAMREQYDDGGLDEAEAGHDPQDLFRRWFDAWVASGPFDANAMILSTVDSAGSPCARTVLMKGFDDRGIVFFTNYLSDKARELETTGRASLMFLWEPMLRQVRITGSVERVSEAESAEYFATRPRGSQIGAWASKQSAVIPDRAFLERSVSEAEERFPDEVPCPPDWGGYLVRPEVCEFWHGRLSRLHDRIRFRKIDQEWIRDRLSP